jgi:hypothetical protein
VTNPVSTVHRQINKILEILKIYITLYIFTPAVIHSLGFVVRLDVTIEGHASVSKHGLGGMVERNLLSASSSADYVRTESGSNALCSAHFQQHKQHPCSNKH